MPGRMSLSHNIPHEHKKDKVIPRSPAAKETNCFHLCCRLPITLVIEDPEIFVKVELSRISFMETLMLALQICDHHTSPTQSFPLYTHWQSSLPLSKSVCKTGSVGCLIICTSIDKSKRKIKNQGSSRLWKKYNDFLVTRLNK